MQDTLGNLGSGDEFSDEAFDEVFSTFDKDNSGTVEKSEMVVLECWSKVFYCMQILFVRIWNIYFRA